MGIKALIAMSENKEEQKNDMEYLRSLDAEFENFIPHLIDMSKNSNKYNDELRLGSL